MCNQGGLARYKTATISSHVASSSEKAKLAVDRLILRRCRIESLPTLVESIAVPYDKKLALPPQNHGFYKTTTIASKRNGF